MMLIIYYLALVAAGDVLAYLSGLFVEYEWGSNASLIVFLAIYFVTLWAAWVTAVWLSGPKKRKPLSASFGARNFDWPA
jgi:hypothetical protein